MSVYRVHFRWKDKEVALTARKLDLTHPYFVSIKDLLFSSKPKLIIDPLEDEVRRRFGGSFHLMIPFQTVALIEEVNENDSTRIVDFPLVVEEPTGAGGGGGRASRPKPSGSSARRGRENGLRDKPQAR